MHGSLVHPISDIELFRLIRTSIVKTMGNQASNSNEGSGELLNEGLLFYELILINLIKLILSLDINVITTTTKYDEKGK